MNSESVNYETIFCAEDDGYGVYCGICDKLCLERYYKKNWNQELTQILSTKDNDWVIQIKRNEINGFH